MSRRPDVPAPAANRYPTGDTRWANAMIDGLQALTRQISHYQALRYTQLAELARDYPGLREHFTTEIALAHTVTDHTAQQLIDTGDLFTRRVPATLHALHTGQLNHDQAAAMITGTSGCTDRLAAHIETQILPAAIAAPLRPGQIRAACTKLALELDPDLAAARHREEKDRRHLTRQPEPDGMARLSVYAPADNIATIWEAIDHLAHTHGFGATTGCTTGCADTSTPAGGGGTGTPAHGSGAGRHADTHPAATGKTGRGGNAGACASGCGGDHGCAAGKDRRNLSKRRVDALTELARRILTGGGITGLLLPEQHRRAPHIQITIPHDVFLGAQRACHLTGHGPIHSDQALDIIDRYGALYTRLICDPDTGALLNLGHTRYHPSAHLTRHVNTRDQTCTRPGCTQPAQHCEIDHITPYSEGGPTSADNLTPHCKHDHRAKDGGGHTNQRHPDGTNTWTTPLGRTYHHTPDPLWTPPPEPTAATAAIETLPPRPDSPPLQADDDDLDQGSGMAEEPHPPTSRHPNREADDETAPF